jgi:hypothetical protein
MGERRLLFVAVFKLPFRFPPHNGNSGYMLVIAG